jgi:16S rRNA (guanine527-N7)-methyltransferase
MEIENRELLIRGALELGVGLGEDQVALLERYLALLEQWSQKINLTGIKDERGRVLTLLVDSLAAAAAVRKLGGASPRLLDLGSGAGLPGVPLKVVMPGLVLTLCESRLKKAAFLEEVVRELGLAGTVVYPGRAEDLARAGGARKFNGVIARAVADLKELGRWSAPLLKAGGCLLAMKGPAPEAEIAAASRELARLGMAVTEVLAYALPEGEGRRTVVIVKKA